MLKVFQVGAAIKSLSIGILILLSMSELFAGVEIRPLWFFINSPSRSVSATIRNPGATTIEVWIEFKHGYPTSNDERETFYHFVDSSGALRDPVFLHGMRVFPRRFQLKAEESQVVQFSLNPPAGMVDGEYWALIVVNSKEAAPPPAAKRDTGPAIGLTFVQQLVVPIHYRRGNLSTGMDVRDLKAVSQRDSLIIQTMLDRRGTASYWGTAKYRLISGNGVVVGETSHSVALYRQRAYDAIFDVSKVAPGEYSLEVVYSTVRHDVNRAQLLQATETKRVYRVPVKMMGSGRR